MKIYLLNQCFSASQHCIVISCWRCISSCTSWHHSSLCQMATGMISKRKRKRKERHCKSCPQLRTCQRLLVKVVGWTRSLMKAKRNLSRVYKLSPSTVCRIDQEDWGLIPHRPVSYSRWQKEKMYCALYYFFPNLETRPLWERYNCFN